MRSGESLHSDVMRGLAMQTIPINVYIITNDPLTCVSREVSINYNRHLLQSIARKDAHNSEYVLLIDSDVVLTSSDVVERLIDRLVSKTDLVAACACTKPDGYSDHVVTSCAVMRRSVWDVVRYMDRPDVCQCLKIAALGGVEYVDSLKPQGELKS